MYNLGKATVFCFFFLFGISLATDGCQSAGNGPVLGGQCADPKDVLTVFNGEQVCCSPGEVVPAPAAVVTTTTKATTTCKDLLNPVTGVSDCPKRAYLCNDSVYNDVMTKQCPLTCGRCGSTTSSTTCADKTNPTTGVSDCLQRKEYCTNSLYKTLMTEQCPKTCGFC